MLGVFSCERFWERVVEDFSADADELEAEYGVKGKNILLLVGVKLADFKEQ